MEIDKQENDEELTSTMGNLMSTNKDEKNDVCDSTPTSSTDASTTSTTVAMADDPISSTSSEITEKKREPIVASTSSYSKELIVSAKDLLDMNISDTSTEKITENVDDIVQDLENLLGEPTSSIDFIVKPKVGKITISATDSLNKDLPLDIDSLSKELELSSEQKNAEIAVEVPKKVEIIAEEVKLDIKPADLEISVEKTDEIDNVKSDDNFVIPETLQENELKTENKIEKPEEIAVVEEKQGDNTETIAESQDIPDEKVSDLSETTEALIKTAEINNDCIDNEKTEKNDDKEAVIEPAITEKNLEESNLEIEKNEMETDNAEKNIEESNTELEKNEIRIDNVESTLPVEKEEIKEAINIVTPMEEAEPITETVNESKPAENIINEIEPAEEAQPEPEPAQEITNQIEPNDNKPIQEVTSEIKEVAAPESVETKMEINDIPEEISEPLVENTNIQQEIMPREESTDMEVDTNAVISDFDKSLPEASLGDVEQVPSEKQEEIIEPNIPLTAFVEPIQDLKLPETVETVEKKDLPTETELISDSIGEIDASSQEILNAVSSIGGTSLDENIDYQIETEKISNSLFSGIEPAKQSDIQNMETLLAVSSIPNLDQDNYAIELPETDLTSKIEDEMEAVATVEENDPLLLAETESEKSPILETVKPIEIKPTELVKSLEIQEKTEDLLTKENKLKEPLVINVGGDMEKERPYSPKITIKPIRNPDEDISESDEKEVKGSLKMTITKQANSMHSILKIYNPEDDTLQQHSPIEEPTVPKLIIKPIVQSGEQPHSPKVSRNSKVYSPSSSGQRSASPRITIKPIKPPENAEAISPLKITIKPVLKPDDRQKHSPKLTIKPIIKPVEEDLDAKVHSPRVTIKPIVKPSDEPEQQSSPRITIKPIVKPTETDLPTTPKLTIKPIMQESEKPISPKITIKPIVKPPEQETSQVEDDDSHKARIVLKINKGNIHKPQEEEKLAKIKLKFSKEGGHPHIVQDGEFSGEPPHKKPRSEHEDPLPAMPISPSHSKLKEMLCATNFPKRDYSTTDKIVTIDDEDDDDVSIVEETAGDKTSPIVISEESNQDSINNINVDPLANIPVFEISPTLPPPVSELPTTPVTPAPRKRGRPRKVPLEVREDFKEETKPVESTRPKRSCRGPSVRTTLGIKPRKPRGGGRGRGSKRGMGTRATPPQTPPRAKEQKLSASKLRQVKEQLLGLSRVDIREFDDGYIKSPSMSNLARPESTTDCADIVMYEEETRMSADTSSRAQTPAKQVTIATVDLVEESQSSIQSTATTESISKSRRGPRLEVQEPEGAVISADQLAEYYWSGGGPYMLQEQVAQFLGIKSFKRKYPNIPRRVVDMQERDFIRESGLAGESMCDLGLTAVNSTDILDIMYSDFQDKYEEYCKHQRDRQAKDLTNKQKALSLAASQEKTKMDITQQAVQSAASWNANFNKTRKDNRKACMDLQTLTVHFPKGKMKQLNKPSIGYYPVSLVPGQFTDYYRELTSSELSSLPLNTICYNNVVKTRDMECDSQTDGSGSESESSSSDSDSSYSGSSDDDCTLCKPTNKRLAAV